MVSKNTILTKNRLEDIEEVIAHSGRIVTAKDVHASLKGKYSRFVLKKRVYELKEKGWLIPLRKGLYYVTDIATRGFVGVSPLIIAAAFDKDSYISMESALSFHGLFEQMLRTVSSVTTHRSKNYKFQENTYKYFKIKKIVYFGYKTETLEGHYIKVAELEKAMLDYLYFKNSTYDIDLIIEKIKKGAKRLDMEKIFRYCQKFPETTRRKLGFILDRCGIDTSRIHGLVHKTGYSRLTTASTIFNAKWRIYCENRFTR